MAARVSTTSRSGWFAKNSKRSTRFLRVAMSVHTGLNSLTLYTWGTEEQKQKYLVPQAKGEKIATYGLTEPGAGSDVVGARSTARREGDE